jgi:RNA polymerase sigma factor (sigma-70 family)
MKSTQKTDDELMVAVRFGDPDALGAIFNRHYEHLVNVARSSLHNFRGKQQVAEDAVQNTFLKVIGLIGRDSFWQQEKGPVLSWLKMIVRQQAIELVRKKSSSSTRVSSDCEPAEDPGRVLECGARSSRWSDNQFQYLLSGLFDSLPRQAIQVVRMTLSGYSNKEIACELGISLSTISRHCTLAKEMMGKIDFGLAS